MSTSIKNQLSPKLKENEKKSKEKEIENCKNYLAQYENASKAFEMVISTFLNNQRMEMGFILELFMEQKD